MQPRCTSGQCDGSCAQRGEQADTAQHDRRGYRLGKVVVLTTVGAGEVATAYGDDLREDRLIRGLQRCRDQSRFPDLSARRSNAPFDSAHYFNHDFLTVGAVIDRAYSRL